MAHDLGDYVGVNERLRLALERWPELRVVEDPPELREDWPGGAVLICRVTVWRTVDDPIPVVGTVTEQLPGRTPYTRGSELMNGMTSALGRALGYLGLGIGRSIASDEEVRLARARQDDMIDAARPDGTEPPTDAQIRTLKALKYSGPTPAGKRDASRLIDKLKSAGGPSDARSD